MKKLIIILLFVTYNLNGQILLSDSIFSKYLLSGDLFNDTISYTVETDTIKVVMMVSDTAEISYGYDSYGIEILEYNYVVRWKFGYEVLGNPYTNYYVNELKSYWLHVKYLDIDKKELSKSVIVWDAVKTK